MAETRGVLLLGEDDQDQSEVLTEFLQQEGYRVLNASCAEEVIKRLSEGPDVVLLDLVGVASPEVFQALNAMPSRPAVVLVSADSRLPERARELSAEGYLPKPYELDELLETIEAVRRRAQREPLTVFS